MRLLRALAHLVLALAFVTVVTAQARAVACAPAAEASRAQHGHRAPAAGVGQAAHDHAGPASGHPPHERGTCQALCCLTAAQLPSHAPEVGAAPFFRSVRYLIDADSAAGRAYAPDPGIPKPLA